MVELPKTEEGLGFNVMGGKEQNSPIYISRIIPGQNHEHDDDHHHRDLVLGDVDHDTGGIDIDDSGDEDDHDEYDKGLANSSYPDD